MVINKYLAELVGTFLFLTIGFLSVLGASAMVGIPLLTVPLGFGFGLLVAIYAVGHVSGGHFNPAVTLAMFLDKRTSGSDLVGYWIGQFAGGLLASLAIVAVTNTGAVASTATQFGDGDTGLAVLVELVLTAAFVLVILASTKTAPATAGIAISLSLVAVHVAGIPFTGASVNPARSFGPAVVGQVYGGLWLYIVVPMVGAVVAWGLWQLFQPESDVDLVTDRIDEELTGLPEPGADPIA
ncbi:MIP family channel protein [soil metagenome]